MPLATLWATHLFAQNTHTQFQWEIVFFIAEGIPLPQYMGSDGSIEMKCTECVIGFCVFAVRVVYTLHAEIFQITYCSLIRSTF